MPNDAVVAVGKIGPAVGDAPQDLAERQRDHQEADPGRPQRQHGEHGGGEERRQHGGADRRAMSEAGLQHQRGRVGRHGEQAGVAERHQPAVAYQHVEREGEDREQQDLACDVDVIGIAGPLRQRRQRQERRERQSEGGIRRRPFFHDVHVPRAHVPVLPNRPCGRSTRTSTIGRNRIT
jgi:hypothetical protein